MQLILGSQSARRKEILNYFAYPFLQISPSFDEENHPYNGDPSQYVSELAEGKGKSLVERYPNAIIISADTIVYKEGKLYPKPKDRDDALNTLRTLSGEWHSVFTGVAINAHGKQLCKATESKVLLNKLNDKQLNAYLDSISYRDKAGSYAIQGVGGLLCNRIEGCYFNIMGLPINTLQQLLIEMGIDLWENLPSES